MNTKSFDVIVIGGGQSGLAAGYYLRRTDLNYLILDQEKEPGGSWQHYWQSLRLFSPAQWSSLPGIIMPGGPDYYPTRDETLAYLRNYEKKYQLRVQRPVTVQQVEKQQDYFMLYTTDGTYKTTSLVSATGTFRHPYIPDFSGMEKFEGSMLHSSQYYSPEVFRGKRVAIVGEGNSGAQILAEVSKIADTLWITSKPPRFLPDEIDGRYLFDVATQMYEARKQGKEFKAPSLGDIVMVPPVKEARKRGVLKSLPAFQAFDTRHLVWQDGRQEEVDAVIFCTGFRPALGHLSSLHLLAENGNIKTHHTKATGIEGLWLVGYGSWTGFASATLIGVGRTARQTVEEIKEYLQKKPGNMH